MDATTISTGSTPTAVKIPTTTSNTSEQSVVGSVGAAQSGAASSVSLPQAQVNAGLAEDSQDPAGPTFKVKILIEQTIVRILEQLDKILSLPEAMTNVLADSIRADLEQVLSDKLMATTPDKLEQGLTAMIKANKDTVDAFTQLAKALNIALTYQDTLPAALQQTLKAEQPQLRQLMQKLQSLFQDPVQETSESFPAGNGTSASTAVNETAARENRNIVTAKQSDEQELLGTQRTDNTAGKANSLSEMPQNSISVEGKQISGNQVVAQELVESYGGESNAKMQENPLAQNGEPILKQETAKLLDIAQNMTNNQNESKGNLSEVPTTPFSSPFGDSDKETTTLSQRSESQLETSTESNQQGSGKIQAPVQGDTLAESAKTFLTTKNSELLAMGSKEVVNSLPTGEKVISESSLLGQSASETTNSLPAEKNTLQESEVPRSVLRGAASLLVDEKSGIQGTAMENKMATETSLNKDGKLIEDPGAKTLQIAIGQALSMMNNPPVPKSPVGLDEFFNWIAQQMRGSAGGKTVQDSLQQKLATWLEPFTSLPEQDQKIMNLMKQQFEQQLPSGVRQNMEHFPALKDLYVYQKMTDIARYAQQTPEELKTAKESVNRLAESLQKSLVASQSFQSESGSGSKVFSFFMPVVFEGQTMYPAHVHIFQQNQPDKRNGTMISETWLRLFVKTDYSGTVNLLFHVRQNDVEVKIGFSDPEAAGDFYQWIPDIRQVLANGDFTLQHIEVLSA